MKPEAASNHSAPSAQRRLLLRSLASLPLAPALSWAAPSAFARVRPGDAAWPGPAHWQQLQQAVGGALLELRSPFAECARPGGSSACAALFASPANPYALGDDPALTQSFGWVDAWASQTSPYAVAARHAADVVAAVNFARDHKLRLVVKGGGHSYQGTSNAADSLLLWTRKMNQVVLHDAFVGAGCSGHAPVRAVSVGAGAIWSHVYDAVTTQAGGYVQGGGCMTVGVAGLVQSGGFGSFSKAWGLAAANLLEAEVVTADGQVRIANACSEPELFWALKGGGSGSLGVLTRLTLRVHALPEDFGAVNMNIVASSDAAFRRLIGRMLDFYAASLLNPHWGEQIRLRSDNTLNISMVFQGLSRSQAVAVWQPFLDAVDAAAEWKIDFSPFKIVSTSARDFWSPTPIKRVLGFIKHDPRPGAPETNVFWPGDEAQAGQFLHAYGSTWLPSALLSGARREALGDALFAASRHRSLSLHVNKGLAGAPPEVIAAARDTAMNPAVLDAFALLIMGAAEPPAYPGIAGHEPHVAAAHEQAQSITLAMAELRKVQPEPASYLGESNYFEPAWQQAFWGANHARLLAVKRRYDPHGLFFVHHGIDSERWSADGFERAT